MDEEYMVFLKVNLNEYHVFIMWSVIFYNM